MSKKPITLSSSEELQVRQIATQYCRECKALGQRPKLRFQAERLGKCEQYLFQRSAGKVRATRDVVLDVWKQFGFWPRPKPTPPIGRPFRSHTKPMPLKKQITPAMYPNAGEMAYLLRDQGFRETFWYLASEYDFATAMRYAHVYLHPSIKGGSHYKGGGNVLG
jgi:hypothetical protein